MTSAPSAPRRSARRRGEVLVAAPPTSPRTRPGASRPLPAASTGTGRSRFDAVDAAIHRWLVRYSIAALRISLGLIFLGFGVLKLFPGVSPAESLIEATGAAITADVMPGAAFVAATGAVEIVIGLTFVSGRFMRAATWLLMAQLVGVLSPLAVVAPRLFSGPYHAPTLEGQYVLKDLILVTAGLVVAATVRGGRLMRGDRSARTTTDGAAGEFSAAEKLDVVLDAIRHDRAVDDVCRRHGITAADFHRWSDEMHDGATRAMALPGEGSRSHA